MQQQKFSAIQYMPSFYTFLLITLKQLVLLSIKSKCHVNEPWVPKVDGVETGMLCYTRLHVVFANMTRYTVCVLRILLAVLGGVPVTSIRRARLVWHLRRLELVTNYVVEASVPTIILFCIIRKDVDKLYKWQMFWPNGLHQSQISHADGSACEIWLWWSPLGRSACEIWLWWRPLGRNVCHL